MGLFSSPKVPNTISDRKMRDIQRRAQWASRKEPLFSKRAVQQRLASRDQRSKSRWS